MNGLKITGYTAFLIMLLGAFLSAEVKSVHPGLLRTLTDRQLIDAVKIQNCSPEELDCVLRELSVRFAEFDSRLAAIARMYVGAPYCSDPLTDEKNNWLPYTKTNCTMLVLYAAALANSGSYEEALAHMRRLHYRNAAVDFTNRYHFTADRITAPSNSYFSTITEQCVTRPEFLEQVTVTLNKKKDGTSFFGGRLDNWSRTLSIHYVARAGFSPGMLENLPNVAGIAFVKKSNWKLGIIVGHEGLLIDGDLYHSSLNGGVRIVENYLSAAFPSTRWDGILFFTLNKVPPALVPEN